jgi:hypothetical protein
VVYIIVLHIWMEYPAYDSKVLPVISNHYGGYSIRHYGNNTHDYGKTNGLWHCFTHIINHS